MWNSRPSPPDFVFLGLGRGLVFQLILETVGKQITLSNRRCSYPKVLKYVWAAIKMKLVKISVVDT